MEAVEFIRTLQKMCTGRHCDDCPLSENYRCNVCYTDDPEESVRIVEEWEKEQESEKTEHPEESSDLHAIIDELEDRIDKLEKKVSNEALIFREVSKLNQKTHRKLADRIDALEKYTVESINEPKQTNKDVLLKVFPDARMNNNGIPNVCPLTLDKHYDCDKFTDCEDCRCVYWLAESEEN